MLIEKRMGLTCFIGDMRCVKNKLKKTCWIWCNCESKEWFLLINDICWNVNVMNDENVIRNDDERRTQNNKLRLQKREWDTNCKDQENK